MPHPRKNESHDDWIERCMSDAESRRDFPKENQRLAFCESRWEKEKNMSNKSWYKIRNQSGVAEILIYDEIGMWGVDARMFRDQLNALGDVTNITMHIHSPGGDVFEALAIYNILKRHPARIAGYVDGVAASAASLIAMAADDLIMPRNTWLMIHDMAGVVMGGSEDMRDMADLMDRIKTSLISVYQSKAGDKLTEDAIVAMMLKDTWISAEEAVEMGLADRVEEEIKLAASIDPDRFRNPPESIRSQGVTMSQTKETNAPATEPQTTQSAAQPVATPAEPETKAPDVDPALQARQDAIAIINACNAAGLSNLASGYIEAGLSLDDVKAKIGNAGKIKDLCIAAKLPDRADNYIKAGLSPDEVKSQLFDVLVAMDTRTAIDNSQPTPNSQPKPTRINTGEVYASRRTSR